MAPKKLFSSFFGAFFIIRHTEISIGRNKTMKKLYFTLAFAIGLIMALGGCSLKALAQKNSDKKVVKVALSDGSKSAFSIYERPE